MKNLFIFLFVTQTKYTSKFLESKIRKISLSKYSCTIESAIESDGIHQMGPFWPTWPKGLFLYAKILSNWIELVEISDDDMDEWLWFIKTIQSINDV